MRVLIVIDVHVPYVLAADGEVIRSVADAVRHSCKRGDFICIVEHRSSRPVEPTHAAVTDCVASYEHWERLMKSIWSASDEVHEMLDRRKITATEFVVCGAVAHECVVDTLTNLRLRHPEVPLTLITSACLSVGETPYDWAGAKVSLNLNLVEQL